MRFQTIIRASLFGSVAAVAFAAPAHAQDAVTGTEQAGAASAETQDQATRAHLVDRIGHLGEQRRVPERRAQDQRP